MNKKYIVQLTSDQRARLEQLTRTGTTAASVQRYARILLQADTSADGSAWLDAPIAAAVEVSLPIVERLGQLFVRHGLDAALNRKSTARASQRKLDGVAEAQLVALTYPLPPEGAGPAG